nr:hypothetical protein CFP56_19432 [Quercus suber]
MPQQLLFVNSLGNLEFADCSTDPQRHKIEEFQYSSCSILATSTVYSLQSIFCSKKFQPAHSMATTAVCVKCSNLLVVEIDDWSDDDEDTGMTGASTSSASAASPTTVPDDVLLPCGDHFHWECLIENDSYELSKCPHCAENIASIRTDGVPTEQILVDLHNEGGIQKKLDIMPILREEAYLRAYPEERKSRAFLELCREGDHQAIAGLLKTCGQNAEDEDDDDDDEDDEMLDQPTGPAKSMGEILRYQDPINDMQSGLHAAAANGHREVAWLLLLLASELSELEFPALVFQEAASLGIMREDQSGLVDIRSLKDAQGRSAEDVARETGVVWNGWIGNRRLTVT